MTAKLLKKIAFVLFVALIPLCANAGGRLGFKAGYNNNTMHFTQDYVESTGKSGGTFGVIVEYIAPGIGLGFDAATMYSYRAEYLHSVKEIPNMTRPNDKHKFATNLEKSYIDIPLNLKWKMNMMPGLNKVCTPFVTTGPTFSFLVSNKTISNAYMNKSAEISWGFGAGVELIKHIQIGVSYTLGITNCIERVDNNDYVDLNGKNRFVSVTAAWLF